MSGIHYWVQPAFSSNQLIMESKIQLSPDFSPDRAAEVIRIIGERIPDYRFWIASETGCKANASICLASSATSFRNHTLRSAGVSVKRAFVLQHLLSLGFVLNTMFIPELRLTEGITVSVACHMEPFNFHPRLLTDNNKVDTCVVTITFSEGSLNSSVELMIISAICRICGFSRM